MKYLIVVISVLICSTVVSAQLRERENSYSIADLQRIKAGQPNSELKTDTLLQFERNKGFSEGLAYVLIDEQWGFINQLGKVVISPQFSDAGCFRNGLAPVEKNGKWGYINKSGAVVVEFKWDWGSDFYEERALVSLKNKWGYIDTNGNVVIPPQFDVASSFSEGLAKVGIRTTREKAIEHYDRGYIDKNGNWVIKQSVNPQYHPVGDFQDGVAHVHVLLGYHPKGGVMVEDAYIDRTGQVIMTPRISGQSSDFFEGLAKIKIGPYRDEKYGFIDKDGNEVIPVRFNRAWDFSEGLVQISISDKWGFANKTGEIVIEPKFESVGYFNEGLAPVMVGHKWGYIDKKGSMVIPPQFDRAWSFSEGFAPVAVNQSVGYIEKSGNYVWKPGK